MAVVICDDVGFVRQILFDFFEEEGIGPIWECRTGDEVIEIVKNHSIEWIFLDVVLPTRNGAVVAKWVKETLSPRTFVCLMSTLTPSDLQRILNDVPYDYFLAKPFGREQLMSLRPYFPVSHPLRKAG